MSQLSVEFPQLSFSSFLTQYTSWDFMGLNFIGSWGPSLGLQPQATYFPLPETLRRGEAGGHTVAAAR